MCCLSRAYFLDDVRQLRQHVLHERAAHLDRMAGGRPVGQRRVAIGHVLALVAVPVYVHVSLDHRQPVVPADRVLVVARFLRLDELLQQAVLDGQVLMQELSFVTYAYSAGSL